MVSVPFESILEKGDLMTVLLVEVRIELIGRRKANANVDSLYLFLCFFLI